VLDSKVFFVNMPGKSFKEGSKGLDGGTAECQW
jgi:hypothetical protein